MSIKNKFQNVLLNRKKLYILLIIWLEILSIPIYAEVSSLPNLTDIQYETPQDKDLHTPFDSGFNYSFDRVDVSTWGLNDKVTL